MQSDSPAAKKFKSEEGLNIEGDEVHRCYTCLVRHRSIVDPFGPSLPPSIHPPMQSIINAIYQMNIILTIDPSIYPSLMSKHPSIIYPWPIISSSTLATFHLCTPKLDLSCVHPSIHSTILKIVLSHPFYQLVEQLVWKRHYAQAKKVFSSLTLSFLLILPSSILSQVYLISKHACICLCSGLGMVNEQFISPDSTAQLYSIFPFCNKTKAETRRCWHKIWRQVNI